jgi:hypothetical protein
MPGSADPLSSWSCWSGLVSLGGLSLFETPVPLGLRSCGVPSVSLAGPMTLRPGRGSAGAFFGHGYPTCDVFGLTFPLRVSFLMNSLLNPQKYSYTETRILKQQAFL